ncbi:MAG TPA: SPOR domain-containing protein [Solirubrobacteraceae bacterium]|nr:SPOR domain-containing protein [Solirubrobacteraceae bacterium]
MTPLAERLATGETACPQCSARLAPDQEWCLECGAGVKVRVRPAPDWRVPAAIVAGVVVLVAVGFVIVLIALSNTADRSADPATTPATTTPATTTPATTTTPGTTTPGTTTPGTTTPTTKAPATTPTSTPLATWPAGVSGYTVVLGVIPSKSAATASAKKIAATGIPAGVLYSSDYSSMRPGDWIVFSGTYTTRAQADTAAATAKTKGQPGAYAFSVVPAG